MVLRAKVLVCVVVLLSSSASLGRIAALPLAMWQAALPGQLEVTVTDSGGRALPAALVIVEQGTSVVLRDRSTAAGSVVFRRLARGAYSVRVEKQSFYTAAIEKVEVSAGVALPLEVRLEPVREHRADVEVKAQPSRIDPEESAVTQTITASEISTIPYPTTRDYRKVLPYIPGVIADSGGQIHVAGASVQEVQDYLDGFEVSQPGGED